MYYTYLQKHTELIYRKILNENVDKELERIEKELYERNKPEVYGGEDGLLVKIEGDFESNCAFLRQKINGDPKKLTVFEFYKAIEVIEKQNEKHGKPKRVKKHK